MQHDDPSESGAQLFNVAISRAKNNLIFIANIEYLDKKLPERSFLRYLLNIAQHSGSVVDARKILSLWSIAEDLKKYGKQFDLKAETLANGLFSDEDFLKVFLMDLSNAKQSIAIFSGFFTPSRIASYTELFQKKILDGVSVRCVTRPPRYNGSMDAIEGKKILDGLELLGVVIDTRKKIHQKVVIVDDSIVWFGSLNPLSHNGETNEIMTRFESREAALQLSVFLALENNVRVEEAGGLNVRKENPSCPQCRCRSTFCQGKNGPYWECEEVCGWTESLGKAKNNFTRSHLTQLVAPQCPKCASAMVPRTGNRGAFWGCKEYPTCTGTLNAS